MLEQDTPQGIPQEVPSQSSPPKPPLIGMMTKAMFLVGVIVGAGIIGAAWYYWPKTTTPSTSSQSSTGSNSGTTTTTAPASCALTDLSMSVGTTEGTAGTIYQHLVFTNKTSKTCTISGYPTVFLLDGSSNVLGSGAVPTTVSPGTTILLASGAKAHIAVGFPQAANFSAGSCTANSVTVRVFLPGTASYLETQLAKPYCPGFSTTAVISGE